MRKFLLATSAAALVLALNGGAFAEADGTSTVALPKTMAVVQPNEAGQTTSLFAPTAGEPARPTDQSSPVEQTSPADQASPVGPGPSLGQTAPADQVTSPDPALPTAAAIDPVSQPLQDLVENKLRQYVPEERDRAGVLAFYKDHNFAPIWFADGKATPRTGQAAGFLRGVAADGLDPADYPTPGFSDTDPAKLAADELKMTNSVVTFARHASIGRVAFSRVSGAVYYDRKAPSPADVLAKIAFSTDERAALASYNPQSPQYKTLKAELAAARSGRSMEAKNLEAKSEPKAPVKESNTKSRTSHRAEQAKAIASKPKGAGIDVILANMERWRWMPHELGAAYVMVNIPDYTLKVVKDGKTVWSTKIVDGKPGDHATPLLTETMKYITVNPTWNVPPSIIRNEYLPALAQDPNALSRIGLKMGRNPDGSIRIYQPPGARNALGRIRFNFPNRFLVYQHDTPDKYLFAKSQRAYSHGCMRVQNPDEYAEVLLGVSQPEDHYTAAKIRSMYGTSERNISLKHHIPIYLTYQTAFTDDAGRPQTRADIYGLDRDTLKVLHGDRHIADTPMARNYNSSSKPVKSAAAGRRSREAFARTREAFDPEPSGWRYGSSQPSYPRTYSAYQAPDRFGTR